MKILVLQNNLDFTMNGFTESTAFFKKKGLDITFEIRNCNVPFTVSAYQTRNGFDTQTGKPTIIELMSPNDALRDEIKKLVSDNQYFAVMFAWKVDVTKFTSTQTPSSRGFAIPLYPNTEYMQIANNKYFNDKGDNWKTITHEIMHILFYSLSRKGIVLNDPMDTWKTTNDYVENDNPDSPTGNYTEAFKRLAPHMNLFAPKQTATAISQKGIEFIKSLEGVKLSPYLDIAGVPTIGYGSTYCICGAKVSMNTKPISLEFAEILLRQNVGIYEDAVKKAVTAPLTQNQFDALVSLCYNIGVNNFSTSTLVKKLNMGDYTGASLQFAVWKLAGGKVSTGLIARREKEASLFNS